MAEHKEPLRYEVPVQITPKNDLDFREVSRAAHDLVESNRKIAEHERDTLTNLLVRRVFNEDLPAFLARAERDNTKVGVAYLDLDKLKAVNDSPEGHAGGDRLLLVTANGIRRVARPTDQLYRLGGDEFIVIFPGVVSTDNEEELATNITERLTSGMMSSIQEAGFDNTVSIGVVFSKPGESSEALVARADALMYADKQARNSGQQE